MLKQIIKQYLKSNFTQGESDTMQEGANLILRSQVGCVKSTKITLILLSSFDWRRQKAIIVFYDISFQITIIRKSTLVETSFRKATSV